MKVWNSIQNLVNPKPPRDPKPLRVPKIETKGEQTSAKICSKCKGNHDERDCTKFLCKEEKQRSVSPQPIKLCPQVDKSETKVKEKWNSIERNHDIEKTQKSGWKNKMHSLKRRGKNKGMRSLLGLILKGL